MILEHSCASFPKSEARIEGAIIACGAIVVRIVIRYVKQNLVNVWDGLNSVGFRLVGGKVLWLNKR